MALTLKSFVALMDHGIVSWDVLEPNFIKRVSAVMFWAIHVQVIRHSVFKTFVGLKIFYS